MKERKQTLKNNYNYDPYSSREEQGDTRWSRVRRRVGKTVAGIAAGGAIIAGGAELIHASNAEAAADTKAMNEKFEPILKPVAESIADFALDKVADLEENMDSSKEKGYIIPDDDPAKFDVHFDSKTDSGSYIVTAVVGKDAEGNPDASKVNFAQITTISGQAGKEDAVSVVTTIRETDPGAGLDYWGASVASSGPAQHTSYQTYQYEGSFQGDVEDKVETAKEVSNDVRKELEDIQAGK